MANFEFESNDTINSANTGIFGINSGQLSAITDKDVFAFTLTESTLLGMKFNLPAGTTSDWYTIKFLDSNGVSLFSSNAGADLSNINFSLAAGTYYVEVSANVSYLNSNSVDGKLITNQYNFAVSTPPSVIATAEIEANDSAASATQILLGHGEPLVERIDTPTVIANLADVNDKDYFKFSVDQTSSYSFKFTAPSNGAPDVSPDGVTIMEFFKISILDANENVLVSHYVSETPLDGYVFDFGANVTGQYFVKIENGGSTTIINTQQYNFEINPIEPSLENANIINGGKSNNYLLGTANNDMIKGFAGSDVLSGMSGNDFLDGGAGVDVMKGGMGNDTYVVDSKSDSVIENLNAGTDKVIAKVDYTLVKNIENLVLDSDALATVTKGTGNALDNIIVGNQLANTLTGLAGNDILDGKLGIKGDTLVGGLGNDTYYVNSALDKIIESAGVGYGTDIVLARVDIFNLAANVENLKMLEVGVDADGSQIACFGVGNTLANTITGNNEVNQLSGLAGNDTIYGLGGNDAILGGTGNDTLIGGAGSDYFIFDTTLSAATNVDTIVDFTSGIDAIQLSGKIFKNVVAGPNDNFDGELSINHFTIGSAATDANDYIIYNQTTGNLYYDVDGSGVQAAVQFAHLAGGTSLAYTDFTVL